MPTENEKDIYRTLAYFSYFGYPLTAFELWKWQLRPARTYTFAEIDACLQTSAWLARYALSECGFWGLPTHHGDIKAQIATRQERYLDAMQKHRALRKVIWYLARLPWVSGAAICNTLALNFTNRESDMDVFVLAREGSVWRARLSTVLPFLILRKRPFEAKRHAVDTSFFVDTSAPNLSTLRKEDDPYFAVWMRTLVPVFERESGVFDRFLAANHWAREQMPATLSPIRAWRYTRSRSNLQDRISKIESRQGLRLEAIARMIQQWKFPNDIRERMNQGNDVVVTDTILKFHKNDTRTSIAEYLAERMKVCEAAS